jgi:hypothetical protein
VTLSLVAARRVSSFDFEGLHGYTAIMIFVVAFGALAFGGVLIMLIARYSPDAAVERAQADRRRAEAAGEVLHPAMPYEEWRHLIIDLLEALGFHIALEHQSANELEIIARSTEPLRQSKFIVRALLNTPGDVVDQQQIVSLQDAVRGDSAAKGILFTPYRIDSSGLGNLTADLELIDGKKLRALLEEHMPKKLDAIDGYRGF